MNKQILVKVLSSFDYGNDKEIIDNISDGIQSNFTEIIGFSNLTDDEKEKWIEKLKKEYNDYLIKPVKEGGGNNYNYDQVKKIAEERDLKILNDSMIMKRIRPPVSNNIILKNNQLVFENVVTEIGFFTWMMTDIKENNLFIEEIFNVPIGGFIRTKNVNEPEGGISIGAAYVNSGYLVDDYLLNYSKKS